MGLWTKHLWLGFRLFGVFLPDPKINEWRQYMDRGVPDSHEVLESFSEEALSFQTHQDGPVAQRAASF